MDAFGRQIDRMGALNFRLLFLWVLRNKRGKVLDRHGIYLVGVCAERSESRAASLQR
jgi:hypothetical protein